VAFSVVALVAAFNEADVIEHVVRDLIDQGVQVYFMDDGSTDGTVEAVEPYLGRGVVEIERLGARGSSHDSFEWERILRRKALLAGKLDAEWFIHHDADEFRESPWRTVPLARALCYVDRLGFNAVDAVSLDFWPTDDRFRPGTDVREALTHYAHARSHDRRQVRIWKKTAAPVDLASSGGHEVQFPDRRVFPVPFLLRHYPIRSQAHGEQKVLRERRGRFRAVERERGWHVQYDGFGEGQSFIRDASTLTPYDPDEVRASLLLHHPRIGELEDELRASREALQRQAADSQKARDDFQRAVDTLKQECEHEVEAVRRECDKRAAEVAAYNRSLADALRRIAAFENSWTWRLTRPARAVWRWVSGRSS